MIDKMTDKAAEIVKSKAEAFIKMVQNEDNPASYMSRFIREVPFNPFSKVNGHTGHNYQGINAFMLGIFAVMDELELPYFGTFAQIKAAKGNVKGVSGYPVLTPMFFPKKDKQGNFIFNSEGKKEMQFSGKYRSGYVFPLEKAEGIDLSSYNRVLNENPYMFDSVSELLTVYGIEVKTSFKAYYSPGDHHIGMPKMEKFVSNEAYASTLFHELVHSTGTELNRNMSAFDKNDPQYAYEELVAEFGSMIMSEFFGLKYEPSNSAKYIKGWLSLIQKANQETRLIEAYTDASKATKLLIKIFEDSKLTTDSEVA